MRLRIGNRIFNKGESVMRFHHFAIEVSDMDRSIAFYEKLNFVLQDPKVKITGMKSKSFEGDLFYAYLKDASGFCLELIEICNKKLMEPLNAPLCPHLALESDDFEADLALLKERGIAFFDGPRTIPGDVKILSILDPDGYRIDIGQSLKSKK